MRPIVGSIAAYLTTHSGETSAAIADPRMNVAATTWSTFTPTSRAVVLSSWHARIDLPSLVL